MMKNLITAGAITVSIVNGFKAHAFANADLGISHVHEMAARVDISDEELDILGKKFIAVADLLPNMEIELPTITESLFKELDKKFEAEGAQLLKEKKENGEETSFASFLHKFNSKSNDVKNEENDENEEKSDEL